MTDLKPKPIIVCAAVRSDTTIICGARHFDEIMGKQVEYIHLRSPSKIKWEQGFIDQFGKFHNRQDAMKIVLESGQPFDLIRNNCDKDLYSEGLY